MINTSYNAGAMSNSFMRESREILELYAQPQKLKLAIESEGEKVLQYTFINSGGVRYSALEYAIEIQDRESVGKLLAMGPEALQSPECNPVIDFYFSSLAEERFEPDVEILQMLLDHIPDINTDSIGGTPILHIALRRLSSSKCFHLDLIELLLKRGASVCKEKSGCTPFDVLKFSGFSREIKPKMTLPEEEAHVDALTSYLCLEKKYHPNSDSRVSLDEFNELTPHSREVLTEKLDKWDDVFL